jgi:Spy/CpxP family protein refolding chaperone
MKTKFLSLVIIATFLISTVALAQAPKNKPGKRKGQHPKAMMMKRAHKKNNSHKLFTDEQLKTIKAYRLETAKKVKPLKNKLHELMAHQQTLITTEHADLKAINKNIDKMSAVRTEIAKIMAAQHQKTRSLLTEEQLLKFDSMQNKRGHKAKKPHKHHKTKKR